MTTPSDLHAGQTLSADEVMAFGSLSGSWTPALQAATTNPNLGTAPTQTGVWWQQNELVHAKFIIKFGTGGAVAAGSGVYFIAGLPFPIRDVGISILGLGTGGITDVSGGDDRVVSYYWTTGDTSGRIRINGEGFTDAVTNAQPWTWATGDTLWGSFTYPGTF